VTIACLGGDKAEIGLPDGVTVVVVRPTATTVLPGTPNPFMATAVGRAVAIARRAGWLRGYVRNLQSWGRLVVDAAGPVDVWHLHDMTGMVAVAPRLGRGASFVYDAHELFLETGTALRLPGLVRRLIRAYERRLVARASAVVTVNDALAGVLSRRYRPRRILAVHNCPGRWTPPTPRPQALREAARVTGGSPIVLYHGALSVNRGIEQLMEALLEPGLETAHVVLLGYGTMREHYLALAADTRWSERVHLLDPVSPAELLRWVASADVGAMPIQPTTLNHRLSTPNKLFECLAAGVPVVVSDFPSMRQIVEGDPAGPLGVVCDPSSVRAVAGALRSLLELEADATAALQARCLAAARGRWNWETQAAGLIALYRDLVGSSTSVPRGVARSDRRGRLRRVAQSSLRSHASRQNG
jgi:glycosyltransferase involved in cell wall biosynthesis